MYTKQQIKRNDLILITLLSILFIIKIITMEDQKTVLIKVCQSYGASLVPENEAEQFIKYWGISNHSGVTFHSSVDQGQSTGGLADSKEEVVVQHSY